MDDPFTVTPAEADGLIADLALQPHPEGGHFRRIHTSDLLSDGQRPAYSMIYYLLSAPEISRWHVVELAETWTWLAGGPLRLYCVDAADGSNSESVLDASNRMSVVRAGVWQAAEPRSEYSLCACLVSPAFDFADFRFVADIPGHEQHFEQLPAHYRGLL